jgi:hypothetical protein
MKKNLISCSHSISIFVFYTVLLSWHANKILKPFSQLRLTLLSFEP